MIVQIDSDCTAHDMGTEMQKLSRTCQPQSWQMYTCKFVSADLQIQTLSPVLSILAIPQLLPEQPGLFGCMINVTPYWPTSLKKDFKIFSPTWVKIGWNARYPERASKAGTFMHRAISAHWIYQTDIIWYYLILSVHIENILQDTKIIATGQYKIKFCLIFLIACGVIWSKYTIHNT